MLPNRAERRERRVFVPVDSPEGLIQMDKDELDRELREGYSATREEDAAINAEWEAATLENWE